ncbi:ATP-grasp fold amidoligase family protein [Salinivibrio costicola]|uniref:ATP-grasp fold amidoligase family protein n=1 Tax=Salinivibrio costicola TaxID=51367 RepID=UPI003F70F7AC
MNKKIKNIFRDAVRSILGPKGYTVTRFLLTHKYYPHLKKPRTFSEKIINRKLYTDPKKLSHLVDKYTVREFVKKRIGEEYLIPLIKVREKITPDDFSGLPQSFVLKTSNGGGGKNVLVVEDKNKLDFHKVCSDFNRYLNIKMGDIVDEHFYDIEPASIIVEKMIKNSDGTPPFDYKIHVFETYEEPVAFIQVDKDRFSEHKRTIYNEDLTVADFKIQPKYTDVEEGFVFPDNIYELIRLAKVLAKGFGYVRVDMYSVDNHIYFGEMTFCHGSGWEKIKPSEFDYKLGKLWVSK